MTRGIKLELGAVSDFDDDKRVRLLGVIDRIRELGVSENVSLPQLVVVGDQSSGKSSLLEGLTGLSFPIASDLCTRFATQIVLRRTPEVGVEVTIIPGPTAHADNEAKNNLLSFQRNLGIEEFDGDVFERIFDEAAECMGVPGPSTKDLEDVKMRFSDNILRIELSGPEHHHLSVVDVPGLFHNPTKYQTVEDLEIIRHLIGTYVTDKRTIILAVMDARNNLANQEVFSMARAADPEGKRTVGIVTKCDALQAGDEEGVLCILKNGVERLNHGWFAVKNRSTQEIRDGVTIEHRHKREQTFFSTVSPWTRLRKDRVGIKSLKPFLGGLLYSHTVNEFPAVITDIENHLESTQQELDLLGPPRKTSLEQRRFLTHIANLYQQGVTKALSGDYDFDLALDSPLKLRMHIQKLNDNFADCMARKGHWKVFRAANGTIDAEYSRNSEENSDIYEWIRDTYRASRGAELPGTVNPTVLQNMFRQQSQPWDNIATSYIEKVRTAVSKFNDSALAKVVMDDELRRKLKNKLSADEKKAFACARNRLSEILDDEKGGILQTVNHYYADNLSAIREERVLARLTGGFKEGSPFCSSQVVKKVHISNELQAVCDLHDILKAYYKVARKRFCDNVVVQVTERFMLGQNGPVKKFSQDMIGVLQDDELLEIAGENMTTSTARSELEAMVERLQEGLQIGKQEIM